MKPRQSWRPPEKWTDEDGRRPAGARGLPMLDALVAFAPERWRSYCERARNVEMAFGRATAAEEAGRSRLVRRGEKFRGLIDHYEREALRVRRSDDADSLLAEIATFEDGLAVRLGEELNSGNRMVTGFRGGRRRKIEPSDLSEATIDFAENALVMPDGVRISGIEITIRTGLRHLPSPAERPEREPLVQMRKGYKRLLPELDGLNIKAQHKRVLDDLGIKGTPPGYSYETFRTKVVVRKKRQES